MNQVVLNSSGGYDIILMSATEEDIVTIRNLMITYGKDSTELFRNKYKLNDIIAFGLSFEISEHNCRRFIPKGKHSDGIGEELYKCYMPREKGRCFLSHYDAKSAWYCVLEMMDNPYYAILVRIPHIQVKDTSYE